MPESPNDQAGPTASPDTPAAAVLPAESEIVATAQLTPATGRTYRILRTAEVDPYDKPLAVADVAPFGEVEDPSAEDLAVAEPAARPRRPSGDAFAGRSRKAAKISIANAQIEE